MKPRGLRWQGDRTARQEQLSDVHPATWPVQVTTPPHQSIHSHWTQLASWAAMDLPSLVGTLGPACIQASWELPGLQWLSPLCTLQLASLSLATPGGEPYWPSSVDTRLVKQVMLLFCTFISNTSKIPRYQEANEEKGFLTTIPKLYKGLHRPQALLKTCCCSLKRRSVFLKIVREELSKVRSKSNALCFYHYCWPLSRESKMHPLKLAANPMVVSIIIFTCTEKSLSRTQMFRNFPLCFTDLEKVVERN